MASCLQNKMKFVTILDEERFFFYRFVPISIGQIICWKRKKKQNIFLIKSNGFLNEHFLSCNDNGSRFWPAIQL